MKVGKVNVSDALKRVNSLLSEDKSVSPRVRLMLDLLVVVINLPLAKLGINSANSSTPPSRDPNRKRGSTRKEKGDRRKPGGQNGHQGTTLKKEGHPDIIELIGLGQRPILRGQYTGCGFESRQVIDIEITKQVTEYRAEILENIKGEQLLADFPAGFTRPVQYGSSIKSQSVYMSLQQLVPYDRVGDYFLDQCVIAISTGSVFNFNKEDFKRLEEFDAMDKRVLKSQPVLHADETGINVNGKLV